MADVRPSTVVAKIGNFGGYIVRIIPHITAQNFVGDVRDWYWNFWKWTSLLLQTILIAYLGTLLGALGAFCLCFLASANLAQHPTVRFAAAVSLSSAAPFPTSSSR